MSEKNDMGRGSYLGHLPWQHSAHRNLQQIATVCTLATSIGSLQSPPHFCPHHCPDEEVEAEEATPGVPVALTLEGLGMIMRTFLASFAFNSLVQRNFAFRGCLMGLEFRQFLSIAESESSDTAPSDPILPGNLRWRRGLRCRCRTLATTHLRSYFCSSHSHDTDVVKWKPLDTLSEVLPGEAGLQITDLNPRPAAQNSPKGSTSGGPAEPRLTNG
jgi:hypothetical protein